MILDLILHLPCYPVLYPDTNIVVRAYAQSSRQAQILPPY